MNGIGNIPLMTMNGDGNPAKDAIKGATRGTIAHDHVVLCDLKSRKRLAYVVLGIGTSKGFEA